MGGGAGECWGFMTWIGDNDGGISGNITECRWVFCDGLVMGR